MRVVLLCAQGMSTSLLVERMKKAASARDVNAEIEAHSMDSIDEQIQTANVILLGPQIRYKKNEFFSKAKEANVPIDVIDMSAYGMIDGEKVLDQALAMVHKK